MVERLLLVDLANVQTVDLSGLPADARVMIFHGSTQKNLPVELVTQTQPLGSRVQWIRMAGQGHNALDFHIAFYLGQILAKHPKTECAIVSKDTGFDPLIRHLPTLGHRCRRVSTLKGAFAAAPRTGVSDFDRLVLLLAEDKALPKNRRGLLGKVKSWFPTLPEVERLALVEQLFAEGRVSELDKTLTYALSR